MNKYNFKNYILEPLLKTLKKILINPNTKVCYMQRSQYHTVPVLTILADMYTDIEMSTFRIDLNMGHTGHVLANFRQY